MRISFLPHLPLEIAAVKIASPRLSSPLNTKTSPPEEPTTHTPSMPSQSTPSLSSSKTTREEVPTKKASKLHIEPQKNSPTKEGPISTQRTSLHTVTASWETFLARIKEESLSLSLLFSNTTPIRIEGSTLVLTTKFAFHCDKLNDQKTRLTGEQLLSTLCKSRLSILCITDEESGHKRKNVSADSSNIPDTPKEDILNSALESFGGTVVEA